MKAEGFYAAACCFRTLADFPQRVVTLFLYVAQTLVNVYLKSYHSLQTSKAC